jgi:hypothetical protein
MLISINEWRLSCNATGRSGSGPASGFQKLNGGNQTRTCRSNKKVLGIPVEVGFRLSADAQLLRVTGRSRP